MAEEYCWGRECKLGWGYNESLDQLIPVHGVPNVTSKVRNEWKFDVYTISSTNIKYWNYINLLLEPGYKNCLEFGIVFDDQEYWEVDCYFYKRKEESSKLSQYPSNCSHYVRKIDYGVKLGIQFPKQGFLVNEKKIENLFKEKNFNETQKETKCRVLINCNEIKKMTLEEFLEFIKELDEGKHPQYDSPISFEYGELDQGIQGIEVHNEDKLCQFLSYLYCTYRKIEMKMEKQEYPNILPDLDPEEQSLVQISSNLRKAKEEYRTIDKNDFLKIYPALKNLFFCYTDYIKWFTDHVDDIDEGNHLPGSVEETKVLLQKLNTWIPVKTN